MKFKVQIKYYWRKFLGLCLACGKRKQNHKDCLHCADTRFCHWHSKMFHWSERYGMGKDEIIQALTSSGKSHELKIK